MGTIQISTATRGKIDQLLQEHTTRGLVTPSGASALVDVAPGIVEAMLRRATAQGLTPARTRAMFLAKVDAPSSPAAKFGALVQLAIYEGMHE